LILGLTGGYCAGKSTAAAILRSAGWAIVDVDALGHRALELSAAAVADLLGQRVLDASGKPDRRAIGAIVFADPELLDRYEALVHPAMNALAAAAVATAGGKVCVDAALLYRLPVAGACDAIIEIRAALPVRLLRAWSRDGLGPRAALARMARQRPLWAAGRRFGGMRIVVRNSGGAGRLERVLGRAIESVKSAGRLN